MTLSSPLSAVRLGAAWTVARSSPPSAKPAGRATSILARPLLIAALIGSALGCGGHDPEPEGRAAWPSGIVAAIDSGNAAYRAGDYLEARRHYRAAAHAAPDVGTAWFGVYMAERALGNEAAADSALLRVGKLGEAARLHHGVPEADGGGADGRPAAHPTGSDGGVGSDQGAAAQDGAPAVTPPSLRHREPGDRSERRP